MKHINRILLVATAVLAPLAARADLAPMPPPGYQSFLFEQGYFHTPLNLSALPKPLVLMEVGCLVLFVVFWLLSLKRKRIVKISFRTVSVFLLIVVGILAYHTVNSCNVLWKEQRKHIEILGHSATDIEYRDSAAHRKKYDKYCMKQYEKLSRGDFDGYHVLQSAPLPRKDAPDKVKEAYKKLRDRAWADYTEQKRRQRMDRFEHGGRE
jgi:hypothetical protein